MSDLLPYIVFGVTAGAIYGLSAMGLVLTYKTSGLFNFGHGAVSAAAAYVFYTLHVDQDLPWPLAVLIVAGVFGPLAGLLLERMAAVLADVPVTYKIAGTVGPRELRRTSVTSTRRCATPGIRRSTVEVPAPWRRPRAR